MSMSYGAHERKESWWFWPSWRRGARHERGRERRRVLRRCTKRSLPPPRGPTTWSAPLARRADRPDGADPGRAPLRRLHRVQRRPAERRVRAPGARHRRVGSILSGGGDVPGEGTTRTPRRPGRHRSTRWRSTRSTTPRTTSRSSTAPTSCTATTTSSAPPCSRTRSGSARASTRSSSPRCRRRPARPQPRPTCAGRSPRSPTSTPIRAGAATTSPSARTRCSTGRWRRRGTRPAAAPTVAATVKHFAGYGASDSGLDRTPADMSLRSFQTYQLPSYEPADRRRRAVGHGGIRLRSTASRRPVRTTCSPRCCASSSASPASRSATGPTSPR